MTSRRRAKDNKTTLRPQAHKALVDSLNYNAGLPSHLLDTLLQVDTDTQTPQGSKGEFDPLYLVTPIQRSQTRELRE